MSCTLSTIGLTLLGVLIVSGDFMTDRCRIGIAKAVTCRCAYGLMHMRTTNTSRRLRGKLLTAGMLTRML